MRKALLLENRSVACTICMFVSEKKQAVRGGRQLLSRLNSLLFSVSLFCFYETTCI